MAIDRTVPSERNNTYTPSEVSRRISEELFDTAFNADQKKALLPLLSAEAGGGLILRVSETVDSKMYFDRTWEEVDNALKAGTPVNVLQASEHGDATNTEIFSGLLPVISTYHIINGKSTPPIETFEAYVVFIPPSSDSVTLLYLKADSADGRLYAGAYRIWK